MKRTIISMLVAALFAGCAAVPPCATIDVPAIRTPKGPVFMFDTEKMGELVERMQALEAGRCTLKGD